MKKVAGTLKLDQAQYRELEAFSKFGSDLDASTKAVLEKGARNVEILKQGQYSPLSVEKQVAILYCGTKGLLRDVPLKRVREFETEFLNLLDSQHKDVLKNFAAGKFEDADLKVLTDAASHFASKFKA